MKNSRLIYDDPRWRAIRRQALARDHYRCVVCQTDISGKGASRVDHIKPLSQGGAPFDLSNLRSLCALCDNQSHREKGSAGRTERDESFTRPGCNSNGLPFDPAHHWNSNDVVH